MIIYIISRLPDYNVTFYSCTRGNCNIVVTFQVKSGAPKEKSWEEK